MGDEKWLFLSVAANKSFCKVNHSAQNSVPLVTGALQSKFCCWIASNNIFARIIRSNVLTMWFINYCQCTQNLPLSEVRVFFSNWMQRLAFEIILCTDPIGGLTSKYFLINSCFGGMFHKLKSFVAQLQRFIEQLFLNNRISVVQFFHSATIRNTCSDVVCVHIVSQWEFIFLFLGKILPYSSTGKAMGLYRTPLV